MEGGVQIHALLFPWSIGLSASTIGRKESEKVKGRRPLRLLLFLWFLLFSFFVDNGFLDLPLVVTWAAEIPGTNSEFQVIREAFDSWLSQKKPTVISAQELYDNLSAEKPGKVPFILDIRYFDSALDNIYAKAHIPGAVNIYWRNILKKENLEKLPKDKSVVVYCYNGHIAGQVCFFLNLLGYEAVALKWGLTSWVCDPEKAPGQYVENEDCQSYPLETTKRESHDTYPFPIVNRTRSLNKFEIIRAAGDAWLSSNKPGEISNGELFKNLTDSEPGNEVFLIDVRKTTDYAESHIIRAINIPWEEIGENENLKKLPANRQIVVYGYTGGDGAAHAVALLNALGYPALNLRWGMTSWTYNKKIAPGRYEKMKDCLNLPYITGDEPQDPLSIY